MEIVPGVWRVPGTRGGNVWLVQGQQAALIDTGLPGNAPAVLDYLKGRAIAPNGLGAVFVTHRHHDHTGSLRALRTATGARTLAHRDDAFLRETVSPLTTALRVVSGRVGVDGFVGDGQRFPEFRGLQVLLTPGHTPGSICFWLPAERVLFTGDTVLSLGDRLARPLAPPWARDAALEPSLARLAALSPQVIASGHGAPVTERAADLLRELKARPPRSLVYRVAANWRRLLRFGRDMSRPTR